MATKSKRKNHMAAGPVPDPDAHERRLQEMERHYERMGVAGPAAPGRRCRRVVCRCGCNGDWPSLKEAAEELGADYSTLWSGVKAGRPVDGHRLAYA